MRIVEKVRNKKTKVKSFAFRLFAFIFILCVLVFLPCGCGSFEQPGETAAEGHRRHLRNARINRQEMMQDIDRAILYDEPSGLAEKRIP